jgi:taurine transport system substrate-binding protein
VTLGALALSLAAHASDLTIGYITGIDPVKRAIADGEYEKAIGTKIDWRQFDAGPAVLAAMASGDVQIGNLGSSPLAAAASRNMPLVAFIVTSQIRSSEALVVRDGSGIVNPQDLIGKKSPSLSCPLPTTVCWARSAIGISTRTRSTSST